jgi:hypothetical protein
MKNDIVNEMEEGTRKYKYNGLIDIDFTYGKE